MLSWGGACKKCVREDVSQAREDVSQATGICCSHNLSLILMAKYYQANKQVDSCNAYCLPCITDIMHYFFFSAQIQIN